MPLCLGQNKGESGEPCFPLGRSVGRTYDGPGRRRGRCIGERRPSTQPRADGRSSAPLLRAERRAQGSRDRGGVEWQARGGGTLHQSLPDLAGFRVTEQALHTTDSLKHARIELRLVNDVVREVDKLLLLRAIASAMALPLAQNAIGRVAGWVVRRRFSLLRQDLNTRERVLALDAFAAATMAARVQDARLGLAATE